MSTDIAPVLFKYYLKEARCLPGTSLYSAYKYPRKARGHKEYLKKFSRARGHQALDMFGRT